MAVFKKSCQAAASWPRASHCISNEAYSELHRKIVWIRPEAEMASDRSASPSPKGSRRGGKLSLRSVPQEAGANCPATSAAFGSCQVVPREIGGGVCIPFPSAARGKYNVDLERTVGGSR